jgi:hypothetical protein
MKKVEIAGEAGIVLTFNGQPIGIVGVEKRIYDYGFTKEATIILMGYGISGEKHVELSNFGSASPRPAGEAQLDAENRYYRSVEAIVANHKLGEFAELYESNFPNNKKENSGI